MSFLLSTILLTFDFQGKAPVASQMDNIKAIVIPNIVKFGGYAIVGVGAGVLVRSISGR